MTKSTIEKIAEIDEHFKTITHQEFEENLKRAGYNEIETLEKSGVEFCDDCEL